MTKQEQNVSDNKRIALNTLFLYFRTILIMFISLYTSRVILEVLGVENFGIYNVVGGVVAMFSVISGALSNSISRFLTYELGHGDDKKLSLIFSNSVTIQLGICIIILFLGETIGVWFLNNHMNIASNKITEANFVLQFSLLTFCINLVSIPYNACIVAHEKMKAFAYVSIIEALCKLLICYLLIYSPYTKLVTYSFLMFCVALLIRIIYGVYCKRHFDECKYHYVLDKELFHQMTCFAGWSFISNGAFIFNTQGVNILINLFFGVALNASRGIALQVESVVMQFVNNFTMAINPQITKDYASNRITSFHVLICRGAKMSFFLLLILALPVLIETDNILNLWLKQVPEHTVSFIRLSLIGSMINVLGLTGATACSATGNIKRYTIVVSSLSLMVFPLTLLFFYLGYCAETAYVIFIIIYLAILFARLYVMVDLVQFPFSLFVKKVFGKIIPVLLLSLITPVVIITFFPNSIYRMFLNVLFSCLFSIVFIFIIGLDDKERNGILTYFKKKINP